MNQDQITKLLDQSIDKAKDDIAALDAVGVEAVRAAEQAGQKRAGIFALLDARAEELADADKPQAKAEAPAPKAGKPKWQADDYTGPLTAAQGEWRQRNIKPAKAITK